MAGLGRFVIFASVAAALALIVAYGGRARPAKQGLQTPVTVGAGPLSRDDFWALVDHSATWGEDADAQLADLAIPDAQSDLEFEAFGYVAPEIWSAKTGQALSQMPEADVRPRPSAPSGTPFKEETSHLAARYLKLWKRFGTWL